MNLLLSVRPCYSGVICQDLHAINRILIANNWFTLEEYNEKLKAIGYPSYENTDKPMPLAAGNKGQKLRGKAVSIWVHLRNWPFMIRNFILDKDDDALSLGLLLHEVTERITCPEFREYEIDILEEKILNYLDLRRKVRENYPDLMPNPKPKHHFLLSSVTHDILTFQDTLPYVHQKGWATSWILDYSF